MIEYSERQDLENYKQKQMAAHDPGCLFNLGGPGSVQSLATSEVPLPQFLDVDALSALPLDLHDEFLHLFVVLELPDPLLVLALRVLLLRRDELVDVVADRRHHGSQRDLLQLGDAAMHEADEPSHLLLLVLERPLLIGDDPLGASGLRLSC